MDLYSFFFSNTEPVRSMIKYPDSRSIMLAIMYDFFMKMPNYDHISRSIILGPDPVGTVMQNPDIEIKILR